MRHEIADGGLERFTITLPSDVAALLKAAVEAGDYTSASEAIRDALRHWSRERDLERRRLAELKIEIDRGVADVAAGRCVDCDAKRIAARGRSSLAAERSGFSI